MKTKTAPLALDWALALPPRNRHMDPRPPTSAGRFGWLTSLHALSLALALAAPSAFAVSLVATHDAYVRGGTNAGSNYGSSSQLKVKYDDAGAAYQYESYLKFDLTSVSDITSAKVRLYGSASLAGGAGVVIGCYSVSSTTWTESTVTWNNKPAPAATALATVTMGGTTAQWYEWDITSYAQAEKAAGRNLITLAVKSQTDSDAINNFNSSEASSNKAELLVLTGGTSQVAAPTFTPAAGTYSSTQSVTISSATSGATIRYTTNGTTPTATTGTVYSSPVSISTTTTLKAIAYKSGMTDSTVTSGTYTISTTNSVPNITTTSLANATLATAYSQTLAATGGNGTLVWSLASGALPAGLSLSSGGVISGTPAMNAAGSSTFTVRVADSDGITGSTDEDTQVLTIETKAGIAGVRRAAGVGFLIGGAPSNVENFRVEMGRTVASGDPIRFVTSQLSIEEQGGGFLGVAKQNSWGIFDPGSSYDWANRTDVTLCIAIPLYTAPDDVKTLANRQARLQDVVNGTFDADFRIIFQRAIDAGMAANVIWRIASEAEIAFNPYYKLDVSETLWRQAWDRVVSVGKGMTGGSAFRFDYMGNGQFFNAVSSSDPRDQWQYGLPTSLDVFGCDLYIGGKTTTTVLAEIIELQAVAASLGKPFSIPEIGAWTDASGRNSKGYTDTDVKNFVSDVITLMKSFPANGPGSCLYWNWFEAINGTALVGTSGGVWPKSPANWPLAWAEYKAQLGN